MAKKVAAPNIMAYRGAWLATSFLAKLSDSAVRACQAVGEFYEYSVGETLIREGNRDRKVYLLVSGCVKVTAKLVAPRGEALLGVRASGDVVGELAALDGRERAADVQACDRRPTLCCVLEPDAFRAVLAEDGDALLTLTTTVGAKLRASTRRRIDYLRCKPVVRMARVLVELAEDHGQRVGDNSVTIGVNLANIELGTLIGVGKATAERAVQKLRNSNLIVTRNPRPVIRDLDRLRAVAQITSEGAD